MKYRFSFMGSFCLLSGLGFAAGEVWGAWEFLVRDQGEVNYMVLVGCGVAGVSPFLLSIADWYKRTGAWLRCLQVWVIFIAAAAFVFLSALQRTSSATDAAQTGRDNANRARTIAERTEKEATADIELNRNILKTECGTGWGGKCTKAEAARDAAQVRLDKARAALLSAPGNQQDGLSIRISKISMLSEDTVRLYQPLFLPALVSLLAAMLISTWARMDFSLRQELPTISAIPLNLESPQAVEPPQAVAALPPPKRPTPKREEINADPVVAFMKARMERAPGKFADWGAIYATYLDWHSMTQDGEPLGAKQFGAALGYICQKAGIRTDTRDGRVICKGMRLA